MSSSAEVRDQISALLDQLDGTTLAGYAEEELPSDIDETFALLVQALLQLSLGEREQIMYGWFESDQLKALGAYAMRMGALALAERSDSLLLSAYIAQAIEGFRSIEDELMVTKRLTVLRDVAEALGVDATELAWEVAGLANPGAAEHFRGFFPREESAS